MTRDRRRKKVKKTIWKRKRLGCNGKEAEKGGQKAIISVEAAAASTVEVDKEDWILWMQAKYFFGEYWKTQQKLGKTLLMLCLARTTIFEYCLPKLSNNRKGTDKGESPLLYPLQTQITLHFPYLKSQYRLIGNITLPNCIRLHPGSMRKQEGDLKLYTMAYKWETPCKALNRFLSYFY